jgi:uncharacterized protein (TIGR04141 family)
VYRIFSREEPPKPDEFQVLTLPFFSRVNIRHASRRLEAFGYRTALAKIQVGEIKAKLKKLAPH